ncbi:hypothetical protein BHE74_00023539, partial [Ensete ventricosum]
QSPCISSPFPSLLLHLVGVHLAGEDTGIVTPPGRNRRSVAPSLASPSRCNSCLLTGDGLIRCRQLLRGEVV